MTTAANEGPKADVRNKAVVSPCDLLPETVPAAQKAHVQPKLRAKNVINARWSCIAERVSTLGFAVSVILTFTALAPLGMGVAVAGHAVVDVADAFLQMFADQVGFLMLVAVIAGELAEIVRFCVASGTGDVMWPGQSEKPCVVDGRSGPVGLGVTGAALRRHPCVDDGLWCRVAGRARRPRRGGEHGMGKCMTMSGRKARKRVIGVAAHAVGIRQTLMKRRHWRALHKRPARDGAQADVGHGMACRAPRLDGALHRRVAGKAIGGKVRMGRDQRARGQHRIGVDKGEGNDAHQIGGDDHKDPAFHDHPQKMRELTICAVPRTAKASVIG